MSAEDAAATDGEGGQTSTVALLEIINQKGLHARASAKFASTAEQFDAEVKVTRQDLTVNGESIMGLLMLAASKGSTIRVEATGAEAGQAVEALRVLVEDRFGEGE